MNFRSASTNYSARLAAPHWLVQLHNGEGLKVVYSEAEAQLYARELAARHPRQRVTL